MLDNVKKTRLKVVVGFGIAIFVIAVMGIIYSMPSVATAAVTALGGGISVFMWGETKRPSNGFDETIEETEELS